MRTYLATGSVPDAALDAVRDRWPTVVAESTVADTNHFTIVLGAGAPSVVAEVRAALGA